MPAGIYQPPGKEDDSAEQKEGAVVEGYCVIEVQRSQLCTAGDAHAVVATILFEADKEEVGHLREGEGNHDEEDAARAQADCSDQQADTRTGAKRDQDVRQASLHAMMA